MMNYQLSDTANSSYQPIERKKTHPWWVKIITARPKCVYYFGPFDSKLEAAKSQFGYIEDLEAQARDIGIEIEQARPKFLTVLETELLS